MENGELRVKTFGFLRSIETAAASHRPTPTYIEGVGSSAILQKNND